MKIFFTLVCLILFGHIHAQNLVKNPSFEEAHKGPLTYGEFHNNVWSWSSPNLGTPDYFSIRSRAMNARNYRGNQDPKTGDCYAGMYLFAVKNGNSYREYVQVELQNMLKKNIFLITLKLLKDVSLSFVHLHQKERVGIIMLIPKVKNIG